MESETGLLTIKYGDFHYSLSFSRNGWLAAELVQYLDEVIEAGDTRVAILKLLGYTMLISRERPERIADHWIEVDLAARELTTNSEVVRQAVEQEPPTEGQPYGPLALRRIHAVLDKYDFTVRLKKR
ncbi:MAG: hypothetical protein EHM61_11370 [Acidobacteria bacterium]|nr:MAG: hypothetical protein EHM61_11370 [Acidobacteriota bacterium]